MATSKLAVFNGALLILGERSIASLSEEREARRLLDTVYDDGGVRFCLEQGSWQFAMRSIQLDYSPSIEPDFGFRRAFDKPTDWVATHALCSDEYFNSPLLQYTDEVGFWFADLDTIYVKYVSDDTDYGMDFSLWPYSFTEYVKYYFAGRIAQKLNPGMVDALLKPQRGLVAQALKIAKNKDALAEPTKFPAEGGWNGARRGNSFRRDRGNRGNLIG